MWTEELLRAAWTGVKAGVGIVACVVTASLAALLCFWSGAFLRGVFFGLMIVAHKHKAERDVKVATDVLEETRKKARWLQ